MELVFENHNITSLGIDVGSTTVKLAVVKDGRLVYSCYERHQSKVRNKVIELIGKLSDVIGDDTLKVAISGSAGMGLANAVGVPFIQEVVATGETVKTFAPDTDVVIELGGEDAKVIFFKGVTDERMNGSCAGGTGAFIDQMANLLNVDTDELDKLSLNHEKIYPIASRCGVFAKTDIQPLINQGAKKEDIAASIFQAVVNQTISGLVQGYEINGKVMFLGGPLYYCHGLRERFIKTLDLNDENALFPEYGLVSVAIGSAIYAMKSGEIFTVNELVEKIENASVENECRGRLAPLFENGEEYEEFKKRHDAAKVEKTDISEYEGNAYLGIDCGSTTTKLVLLGENNELLYTYYNSNKGNPLEIIKTELIKIYELCKDKIIIKKSSVTGYGEELMKHAFGVDYGIVETMAHFYAAKHFNPEVDFILDIGGQDIKCFKIKNNAIDSIMLNEACSSGCGSFIETFANLAGFEAKKFAKLGIMSKAPVDLGSRCTVFMNSSVKQAQKDGADIKDISSGLSVSVVKNAIYKVIRANSSEELGKNIVVQGGTFLNDAVLRSFEKELGINVVRPEIAGLMGAYGAALYAKQKSDGETTLFDLETLKNFKHKVNAVNCMGCENHCNLTVNIFGNGEKFISGNKCEKGLGKPDIKDELPDVYRYKRDRLSALKGVGYGYTIGIPMALSTYELAPLWHGIFSNLGINVLFSDFSNHNTYTKGQHTIPSDTVCYPAKLMHGHIEELIEKGVDAVFYPCLTYNINEHGGDNHYNCPVVAYYSELLKANVKELNMVSLYSPYLNINNKKEFAKGMLKLVRALIKEVTYKQVLKAVENGYEDYYQYLEDVKKKGREAIEYAQKNGKRVLILAGRPYHTDPEICHMIDKLATSLDFVVVSEDSVDFGVYKEKVDVLNQWTYHGRLYRAARYAVKNPGTELVQLVSFGCGIDAITTDEVRRILEENGKIYTQLKIDEVDNLGAVKIRLRSLKSALDEREGK